MDSQPERENPLQGTTKTREKSQEYFITWSEYEAQRRKQAEGKGREWKEI